MRILTIILTILILSGCAGARPLSGVVQQLPPASQQVILVEPLQGSRARMTTWEFKDGDWHRVFSPMRAMVGRKGLAPHGEKREGDGRTPSGVYAIGSAFGYASSLNTKLNYRQATARDFWVDDASSPQYNTWVTGQPQATSFERMHRADDLYKYGAVIEYNTKPIVPGFGSAIFLHIWRAPDVATSGCVALSSRSLKKVLRWLDGRRNPVIVLGQI